MNIRKKLLSLALTCTMALGMLPGMTMTALAGDTTTTSYTLTIPSTLSVANSGWNATDGISASGTLEEGKKLTVTASSANSWALVSGENSVGYKLAAASTDTDATTSWEFTELSSTAATEAMGIIVEDYSSKPAGSYTDTVTFTAKVEDATLVTAITLNKTETTIYIISGTATETLSVSSVTPDDATDKTVTWSSSNENVATVDASTGVVTAVAEGTANITATASDGSGVTATCAVTVTDITSISGYYSALTTGEDRCSDIINREDNGQTTANDNWIQVSSEVAVLLAKAKAAETNKDCAVYYKFDSSTGEIYFAKSDGTTANAQFYYDHKDKGLTGYNVYHIAK